jgi:hypothetical protein
MLDRSFDAPAPNCKWIADFTYIWTAEEWLYVAAVVDLFSRRVVGWSMSATMTAQLVTDALVMAIWRRGKPRALLHHSDRGSQYNSEPFQRLEPSFFERGAIQIARPRDGEYLRRDTKTVSCLAVAEAAFAVSKLWTVSTDMLQDVHRSDFGVVRRLDFGPADKGQIPEKNQSDCRYKTYQ